MHGLRTDIIYTITAGLSVAIWDLEKNVQAFVTKTYATGSANYESHALATALSKPKGTPDICIEAAERAGGLRVHSQLRCQLDGHHNVEEAQACAPVLSHATFSRGAIPLCCQLNLDLQSTNLLN